ncbi:MAG: DUF2283 domain-containing protein [Desulfohalobiaceae bacterium]|jgi:uncharacterized protein YuzE|nr:DUF2283 domain-containing protein [Desulfohalobiaceae bacterium]
MATSVVTEIKDIRAKCIAMMHDVLELQEKSVWLDYDQEADVLYISFRKPQRAKKTIEIDEDFLVRKDGDRIVGVTIMNASLHQ